MKLSENKREYLKKQIGFHLEDLTARRQLEFKANPSDLDGKLAALSEGSLEDWNKGGFKLWGKINFVNRVNNKLKVIEEMNEEELNPEVKLSYSFKEREKTISVNELAAYPNEVYTGIDDNKVVSLITNTVFTVCGGREAFDNLDQIPECRYRKNKSGEGYIYRY